MMNEHEVLPTLLKIVGDPVKANAAVIGLNEVAQEYELNRRQYFLEYAEGYKRWLQAGLGLLSGDELKEIGQSSSDIVSAFVQRIAKKRNSLKNPLA